MGSKTPPLDSVAFHYMDTLKLTSGERQGRLLTSETVPEVILCIIVLKKHVSPFMNAAACPQSWVSSLAVNTR